MLRQCNTFKGYVRGRICSKQHPGLEFGVALVTRLCAKQHGEHQHQTDLSCLPVLAVKLPEACARLPLLNHLHHVLLRKGTSDCKLRQSTRASPSLHWLAWWCSLCCPCCSRRLLTAALAVLARVPAMKARVLTIAEGMGRGTWWIECKYTLEVNYATWARS